VVEDILPTNDLQELDLKSFQLSKYLPHHQLIRAQRRLGENLVHNYKADLEDQLEYSELLEKLKGFCL
jgi:hypothetical protein